MKRKHVSKALAAGEARAAALKSIDPAIDFGNGVGVKALEKANASLSAHLAHYNKSLADAEADRILVKADEANVRDLYARTLSGVAGRFGKNSSEYAQAGGKKTSERKRRGEGKRALAKKAAKQAASTAAPHVAPAGGDSAHAAGLA